ncbi:MAG: hypothetical protein ABFD89_28860 [Bryobacteraceae bacterium]
MAKPPFARPGSDLSAPAEIGGAPAIPTPRKQTPPDPQQELKEGEGGVDLKSMGFHDGSENCSVCEYCDGQSNQCTKATGGDTSVGDTPESAWCHGFEAADESTHGSDALEEGEESASGR